MKEALTYTIVSGSMMCPNNCPICISKMTPDYGIGNDEPIYNSGKFKQATMMALNHKAKNVMFTGKGEATEYPGLISRYLIDLAEAERTYGMFFDRKELQTAGNPLALDGKECRLYDEFLDVWRALGLGVVAVSMYHYDDKKNKEMFRPKHGEFYELPKLIEKLRSKDFDVRLACTMLKDHIDSVDEVKNLIDFAKENDVFQLTLRTADKPDNPRNKKIAEFVEANRIGIGDEQYKEIVAFLEREGKRCDLLPHGATIYEVNGQNVGITTGLTQDAGRDEIRQLIYFPQGWLTTSWENVQGGRIL